MCGIAGYFQYNSNNSRLDPNIIQAMTSSLEHRGPDAEGYWEGDGIVFGHRRLKIIDLEGGVQPMTSAHKRTTLTYNGEIYNFESIRESLEKEGYVFKTRSDTESLLYMLESKWTACLPQLEGMFAFACFDKKENKLLLAVDPYGKKPLYYCLQDGVIIFASEAKALLKHPLVPKSIDEEAIALYMAFEYVPAPKTIYKSISKLEGGTYLEIKNGEVSIHRYDTFPDEAEVHNTEGAWKSKLTEGLRSAVRKRLVSDVPLGVFLSGGLDSSAILASVRSLNPSQKIKTFTIGFDEPSFDESHYARQVSDHFSTEHIEEKLTIQDMLNQHESILSTLDEPLADASYIPTFLLCKLVRQHVTVALAGDGGDEVFCGYPTFEAERLAHYLNVLPTFLIKGMKKAVNALPVSMDNLSIDFKLKQFFKGMGLASGMRNQVWLGSFNAKEMTQVLQHVMPANDESVYEQITNYLEEPSGDYIRDLQKFYMRFYLQGDILVKADRASMANSLEVRSPLLDHEFSKSMLSMPSKLKLKGNQTKYLFKKAMDGRLPHDIIHRPKKGFGIPVAHWIRGDLKKHFEHALSPARIQKDDIFNSKAIQALLQEHLSGKKDNRKQLWTLYVFQKWKENWL